MKTVFTYVELVLAVIVLVVGSYVVVSFGLTKLEGYLLKQDVKHELGDHYTVSEAMNTIRVQSIVMEELERNQFDILNLRRFFEGN